MARIRSWRAIARSTSRVSGRSAPSESVTCTASTLSPRPRSSCWSRAHWGTLSPSFGSVLPAVSAGESTVGIQTIRAPSRAAISTASAFMPPTAQLRVSVPTTSHLRDERRDDLRALGGGRVVRLEGEPGEPELGETLRERAVVDPPLRHVRSDVDVQVVRTLHEHARPIARSRLLGRAACRHDATLRSPRRARRAARRSPTRSAARRRARASSSRAASISSTRRTACCPAPLERTLEATAGRSSPRSPPRASSACPAALGRVHALDDGGGEPLHEDRAHELQRGGVTGLLRDHLDGHAERLEQLRERLRAGARREHGSPQPALPGSVRAARRPRSVRPAPATSVGELALQRRRRRVQVRVDRALRAAPGSARLPPRRARPSRAVDAEHDVAPGDRRGGVGDLGSTEPPRPGSGS